MRALATIAVSLLSLGAVPAQAATVWVTHATQKVRPGDAPGTATSASIAAARNEFEAFQVVVHGGAGGATGVSMSAPTLTGPGGATIPAANVRLYREALITTVYASNSEVSTGPWPDALVPDLDEVVNEPRNAFPFDVPANENRAVWVEVLVPQGAAPGTYTGTLAVSGGASAQVPVTLTVWPFVLPSTASLPSTFGIGWDAACVGYYPQGYNAPECGDSGVVRTQLQMADFFLDHRVTIDMVYTGPSASGSGYDWATWDADYQPHLDGTAPTRLAGAKATMVRYSWTDDSAHYAAWAQHFRQRGWFDRTFDYTCDEPPNGCAFSDIPGRANIVHGGDPDFRTLVTTNIESASNHGLVDPATFANSDITLLVPIINEMDDKAGSTYAGDQRPSYDPFVNAGGRLFWYQSCESIGCAGTGPKSYDAYSTGWPSMMIDAPAVRNRVMEWLSYAYRIQGELYYETAVAFDQGGDAWSDQYYFGGNGDGTLIYPGTPSRIGGATPIPVASIRLKLIREGMEDYEYLKLVSDLGDPAFAQAQAARVASTPHGINDDPAVLYDARLQLANRIIALQNPVGCSDGTAANACSATQPLRCSGGALAPDCATCGCPGGQACQADGTCAPATRCGDGACNGGETCADCELDCGACPVTTYVAGHLPGAATIDGQLTEYEQLPRIALAGASGSAQVQAAWDATNLYVAFDVLDTDLNPSPGTEAEVYSGDSVEVMLDPNYNGGASADADDVHLLVDVGGVLADARGWTDYTYASGAHVAVDLEGGTLGGAGRGYRVELALPWASLGVSPAAGLQLGFDVAVNNLSGTTLTSYDWAGLTHFNDPAGWRTLALGDAQGSSSTSGSTGTAGTGSSSGGSSAGATSGSSGTSGSGTSSTTGSGTSGTTGATHASATGCGCGQAPGAELLGLVLAAGLPVLRRRRR